jgi:5-hydroxyisourate hydrolase-like protein (transthyretin family)
MILVAGCSQELPGGPRFETYPTRGVVRVDGQPAELVEVSCHPAADSKNVKYTLSSMTDKDGKFELTTYTSSDGLPEGTYKLSFRWIEPSFVPKDKFNGAYADPSKSKFQITIENGKESDLGVIELSSKGPS